MRTEQAQKNLEYAKYGMERISIRMPFGGLNRKDIYTAFQASAAEIYARQLALLVKLRQAYDTQDSTSISTILSLLKGGFCGDLAEITKFDILEKFPEAHVEKVILDFHSMLVIGRDQNSNKEDISTWGDDALICDPWAKKIYYAKSFFQIRDTHPNIPFFRMRSGQLEEVNEHYLSGNPRAGVN